MSKNSTLFRVSVAIGAIGLVLALMNDFGITGSLGINPKTPGILALLLATAAFFVTARSPSIILSGFLVVQGTSNVSAALLAGATIGVPFGAWVLALGLAKCAITARSTMKKEPASDKNKPESKLSESGYRRDAS